MAGHRAALATAAVEVLAAEGGRGFTHRAVDRAAGLPEGTASRYARTRAALLQLAAGAMFAEDSRAALAAAVAGDGGTITRADDVTDVLVRTTTALLGAPERYRARVELQLEAARSPELRRDLEQARAAFVDALADLVAAGGASATGVAGAHVRADVLVAVVDGVLHRQVVLGRSPLGERELRACFVAVLGASP